MEGWIKWESQLLATENFLLWAVSNIGLHPQLVPRRFRLHQEPFLLQVDSNREDERRKCWRRTKMLRKFWIYSTDRDQLYRSGQINSCHRMPCLSAGVVGQQKATGIRHGNCLRAGSTGLGAKHSRALTACSPVTPQSKGTALLLICTNKANCMWSIRKGTVRSAGDNSTGSTMWEPPGTEFAPGILVYCQLQLPHCAGGPVWTVMHHSVNLLSIQNLTDGWSRLW